MIGFVINISFPEFFLLWILEVINFIIKKKKKAKRIQLFPKKKIKFS